MSANTIFVILTVILAIAVVIYLLAIRKGKEQMSAGNDKSREFQDEEDDDKL